MAQHDLSLFRACLRAPLATHRGCARSLYSEAEQLVKGLYALLLPSWTAAFDARQILLVRLDDYRDRMEGTLRAILAFLRLDVPSPGTWRQMLRHPRANRAPGSEAMLSSTASLLAEFYRPYNQQLSLLSGDARFADWSDQGS
eukprot:3306936-Pleurochrysis_carterae.AAC.1